MKNILIALLLVIVMIDKSGHTCDSCISIITVQNPENSKYYCYKNGKKQIIKINYTRYDNQKTN